MRKRNHYIAARLNDEEYSRFKYLCSKTDLNNEALLRNIIVGSELRERINPDYKEVLWHMDRIGGIIN